ncbi:MAG: hypothetical protein GX557_10685 [Chloroflexi bacterium]|nr:hypothetical protein [Chloroflexota bacterium]
MLEDNERAAWLALLFGGQVKRQAAKAMLQRWCVLGNKPAAELLTLKPEECAAFGLDTEQAAALSAVAAALPIWAERLPRLAAQDIDLVLRVDAAYPDLLPQRLPEAQLPYVLFAQGNLTLLGEPALAVAGSPQPSELAAQATEALVTALAREGQTLLGGHEPGIDRLALDCAWRAGGSTVCVIGQGLEGAQGLLGHASAELSAGRALFLSPYLPEQAASAALGQARLPLITALSEALVLVEPAMAPGDWPGYSEAHASGLPTLVWSGAGAAPEAWLAARAMPFDDAEAACTLLSAGAPAVAAPAAQSGCADEPELYRSPEYRDAESALDALRRAGAVPPALARRLRATGWPPGRS